MSRQIFLDTETTGLEPAKGHRIIEIACVEMVNRRLTKRNFHRYLNPEREIDAGAQQVHGISEEFLADKPKFADIVDEFLAYVGDAEIVIHNAPFDVAFLNAELARIGRSTFNTDRRIVDSLAMAREQFPGRKNGLDALCERFAVDNSARTLHGALLDAELLADVYLAMTRGQDSLAIGLAGVADEPGAAPGAPSTSAGAALGARPTSLRVLRASEDELKLHSAIRERLRKASGGKAVWDMVDPVQEAVSEG